MTVEPPGPERMARSAPTAHETARIAPSQLAERRRADPAPTLLDVRPTEERRLGHLPGDRAIPLPELPRRLGEIPRDRPLIVYDHTGEEAIRAAALLAQQGFPEVSALSGGLDAYAAEVDRGMPRYEREGDGHLVVPLPRPATGCLAYLLVDPVERRAIVVDPGLDPAPYLGLLSGGGLALTAIVETHSHADHLAGHAALHERTGAPIYLSPRSPASYPHRTLGDGEELRAGGLALGSFESPGHTLDHLTLRLGGRIFTGDSLFIGGCGRTDLPGGDPERLFTTFRERYDRLPDATIVHPAHFGPKQGLPEGTVSTLGTERATNEALRIRDRAEFVRYMTEGWPPKPADFDRILSANLADGAPAG